MFAFARRLSAFTVTSVLASIGLVGAGALPAYGVPCSTDVVGDVNGDSHAEAAIGEPFDNQDQTGAVHLLYGRIGGLVADAGGTALDDQLFTQDSAGVPGASETGDQFAATVRLADFNGDTCADLATGVPGEDGNVGRVVVLYGSPSGLVTTGAQSFSENDLFGDGSGVGGETFGDVLGSGDFDDDGFADLAVGAPGERVSGPGARGAVVVIPGSTGGLVGTSAVMLTQASTGVPGAPEAGDRFGNALAGGDFDGNGVDDLAVGAPGENGSGIAQVLPGQAGTGLGALAGASYSQNTANVPGAAEQGDRFGEALAAGHVTGDAPDDLAVGVPGENSSPQGAEPPGEGAVVFLRGSASGLTGNGSQLWSQDSPGVSGVAANHDNFGASLVVAPLDNGPLEDLAIGVPFDDNVAQNAGSVNLLMGRASGLSTGEAGGQRFTQATDGIAGEPEPGDQFGRSVAAPLVQTPDQGSLVVGVPSEDVAAAPDTGMITQLQTFEFGPNPFGSRSFDLGTPGVRGSAAGGDLFGFAVG